MGRQYGRIKQATGEKNYPYHKVNRLWFWSFWVRRGYGVKKGLKKKPLQGSKIPCNGWIKTIFQFFFLRRAYPDEFRLPRHF